MALRQTDAPAKSDRGDRVERGTGAGEYKVKGRRATARQRSVIDAGLEQAQEDNASRRVMIAVVMAMTQESRCGEEVQMTGNDDTGILQQGRNWVSEEDSKKAGPAVHAFLVSGPTSWKKVHGSVKKAPGNLSQAIHEVQANRDPQAYAPWEEEAENTVDEWLETGGSSEGTGKVQQYNFTRGERGGSREDSWAASQRLVEEVGAYRWAAGNVFHAVSGDELRAGKPSLMIHGDEGWIRKGPSWSWVSNRSISECTLEVLSDRWDVMPGAIVTLHRDFGPMQGKWMVWNVSGTSLSSPEATVVLRRPTRLKSEPPAQVSGGSESGGGGAGRGGDIIALAKRFSGSYRLGGGHGPKLSSVNFTDQLDCSSSTSKLLYEAEMFGDRTTAIVSGMFGGWGKPGKGDEFTVWWHAGHVWVEFYNEDGSFKGRFDTGGHPGVSGPRYVTSPRGDQGRFQASHFPGH